MAYEPGAIAREIGNAERWPSGRRHQIANSTDPGDDKEKERETPCHTRLFAIPSLLLNLWILFPPKMPELGQKSSTGISTEFPQPNSSHRPWPAAPRLRPQSSIHGQPRNAGWEHRNNVGGVFRLTERPDPTV